jgi:hypothetical protein
MVVVGSMFRGTSPTFTTCLRRCADYERSIPPCASCSADWPDPHAARMPIAGIFHNLRPVWRDIRLRSPVLQSLPVYGRENDETGLYYYRARYYDLGRRRLPPEPRRFPWPGVA